MPELEPWALLGENLRNSNRQQADHIELKLRSIGCEAVDVDQVAPDAAIQAFTPDQLEVLSRMEHERWNAERLLSGWTLGPKDVENRRTPFLVAYDTLADSVKEYDRAAVRNVFLWLKANHKAIRRTDRGGVSA